jgi:DNA-binding transcriptional regulator YiaG
MCPRPLKSDATRFNRLLWELNLVNIEAAEICGVSERTIYNWLSGTSKIHPSAIKLLELKLRLSLQKAYTEV